VREAVGRVVVVLRAVVRRIGDQHDEARPRAPVQVGGVAERGGQVLGAVTAAEGSHATQLWAGRVDDTSCLWQRATRTSWATVANQTKRAALRPHLCLEHSGAVREVLRLKLRTVAHVTIAEQREAHVQLQVRVLLLDARDD
jgi:hypothetical protein